MDSFSQMSMDSEDSIPKNVYEEVIVDSTIHPFEPSDAADYHNCPSNSKSNAPASESEDETDDDEMESTSRSSTTPSPLNNTPNISKADGAETSTPLQPEKGQANSADDQKTANLKLVLKKSPEYQLVNPSPNSTNNKIFLVTLVPNANASPVYSTAKYSVATSEPKSSLVSVNTKTVQINESDSLDGHQDELSKLEVMKLSVDQKPLKTYGRSSTALLTSPEELKIESEKIATISTKDETDVDSVKSEADAKPSTPKIKRELQQLQKTVNESKILSEFMSDSMGKGRKARKVPLKGGESEGSPLMHPVRSRSRSCSKSRVDSPTESFEKLGRWPSEEKILKRQNMRSQNSEFVQKQKNFLNSIQGDDGTDNSDGETSITDGKSSSHSNTDSQPIIPKRELHTPPKPGWDMFCFKCHSGDELMPCSKCIRSYHVKCVKNAAPSKANTTWMCPECLAIENCLKSSTRSKVNISHDNLSQLLQFALKRMQQSKGFEYFLSDFSEDDYPDYSKYIVNSVTLDKLQDRIEKKVYKCTEEFAVEAKWILHNCSVYFGNNSKITNFAKGIVKVCRQEVTEIDTCSECYYNANTRKDWFVEVCSKPHMLLWAKLKGFPYWPAKSMGINGALVNVRFFGDHDRAYVPIKECFLYSENDPNPPTKQNKKTIKECIKEVDIHIRKIIAKFGTFVYPQFRTVYDPSKEMQQLEAMIPGITDSINNAEKTSKPALTYKIVKTADNHLSIIKKDKEKTGEVANINAVSAADANDVTTNDADKVRKQRVQSTDSSQSNNEVSSTCETNAENTINPEPIEEVKVQEKTVAPMKIQERIDSESTTKTYEVVSMISDQEQTKVNSVILKRKCDNWNAVPAITTKKQKIASEATEMETVSPSEPNSDNGAENNAQVTSNSSPPSQPIVASIKRKRSREDILVKPQKPKLDENKIPPLVLLTPQFVIASPNTTVPTQSTVVSSISALPIVTSLNSAVTVTITQSPVVTCASSVESTSNKPQATTNSPIVSFENSEISIKRLPKKSVLTQPTVSNSSQAITSKTNEKVTETVATASAKLNESISKGKPVSKSTEMTKSIGQETNSKNEPKKVCELIPFEEIKTEKPDSSEPTTDLVEVRSKTATPEHPIPSKSGDGDANSGNLNFRPVVVKTEIMSEDEDLSNASRSEENGDSENSNSNMKANDPAKVAPKVPVPSNISNQKGGKPETKKQRARKSFPNKSNFIHIPPAVNANPAAMKRPILAQTMLPQNNGMVYIPVDPKTSSVSIQNVTTASASTIATSKLLPLSNSTGSTSSTALLSNVAAGSTSAVTGLSSTILTTSLQLPIVYSAISLPSVNGPPVSANTEPIQVACSLPTNPPVPSEQHMLSGFVTPTLASAITDAIVRGPPKLAPRPAGPLRSEGDYVFPTEAGPVSKLLAENAHKMTDFFRSVIEDTLSDMSKSQNAEAKVRLLELELEKLKYTHEKEMAELKHNTDLMLCEMRKSLENEKGRLVAETRKQCELERIRAVEEAKTKQWCAACGKEAQFYCCWNTSYCDYPCQQKHWARHMNTCAQKDNTDANAQRVGVKISPYNVKDKQNKGKEPVAPKPSVAFARSQFPVVQKNTVPAAIKRLIPMTTQSSPRYTIINNNEGNWSLLPPQFSRMLPASGLIMSDGSNKSIPAQCSVNMIRPPKM